MARGKRIIGIDAVNQQIEAAEAEVIKAKKKYTAHIANSR